MVKNKLITWIIITIILAVGVQAVFETEPSQITLVHNENYVIDDFESYADGTKQEFGPWKNNTGGAGCGGTWEVTTEGSNTYVNTSCNTAYAGPRESILENVIWGNKNVGLNLTMSYKWRQDDTDGTYTAWTGLKWYSAGANPSQRNHQYMISSHEKTIKGMLITTNEKYTQTASTWSLDTWYWAKANFTENATGDGINTWLGFDDDGTEDWDKGTNTSTNKPLVGNWNFVGLLSDMAVRPYHGKFDNVFFREIPNINYSTDTLNNISCPFMYTDSGGQAFKEATIFFYKDGTLDDTKYVKTYDSYIQNWTKILTTSDAGIWTCNATVCDSGSSCANTPLSNEIQVYVSNAAPVQSQILLDAENYDEDEDITINVSSTDGDGDALSNNIEAFVNDISILNYTMNAPSGTKINYTFSNTNYNTGDLINFSYYSNDTYENSGTSKNNTRINYNQSISTCYIDYTTPIFTNYNKTNITLIGTHGVPAGLGATIQYLLRNEDDDNTIQNWSTTNKYLFNYTEFADNITLSCRVWETNLGIINISNSTINIPSNTINKIATLNTTSYKGKVLNNIEYRTNLSGLNWTTNPQTLQLLDYINRSQNVSHIKMTIVDLNGWNHNKTVNISLWENQSYYNFNLTPYNIVIRLNTVTNWVIRDETSNIKNGTNQTVIVVNQELDNGKVRIDFGLLQGGNYSNAYEFINDYDTIVDEDMTVLTNMESYSWFKVYDEGNYPLEDTIIRALQGKPTTGNWENYTLIGQKLTNDQGLAQFYYDENAFYTINFSKSGYKSKNVMFHVGDLLQVDEEDAMIVRLEEEDSGTEQKIMIYHPREFGDRTDDIQIGIVFRSTAKIKYLTDYRLSQGETEPITITRGSRGKYTYSLISGEDFNTNGTSDVIMYVYIDDALERSLIIEYKAGTEYTEILPIEDIDALSTTMKNVLLIFVLITISSAIGLLIKSDTAGFTAYMFGSIIIGIISTSFGYVSLIALTYFILRMVHKVIEQ